jgi:4-hydroxybenzoate polyprenyltransferase/phosphoserine phosphatase
MTVQPLHFAGALSAPPLVVDLDGSLLRTDTLHEAILGLIAARPLRVFAMMGWLLTGKAGFKARLAAERIADPETLPLNADVLARIAEARAGGRHVALVTAADQRQADAVAAHLDLFDEVIGSDGTRNLSSEAKGDWLVARFGEGGFDYIGDHSVDLPIWRRARRAITVGAGAGLRRRVGEIRDDAEHLSPPSRGWTRLRPYLKQLRPHQWLKNLLVFVPAVAAHDLSLMPAAAVAFVAFSLMASSVYLLNDMLDLEADRRHPRKRTRPFAAADIPLAHGPAMIAGLMGAAVLVSVLFTPPLFWAVLAGYFALTLAYSLYLKRRLIVDVWTLAGLYSIRILAGAAATGLEPTPWLLAFSMFIFLALAAVKRQAEMTDLGRRGQTSASGRAYEVGDLPVLLGIAMTAGYCAVLVFALYISSDEIAVMYAQPLYLWMVCPLLLYWISRVVMITHRGQMDDDPIVFAVRDRVSLAVFALSGLAMMAAALS